VTVIVLGATWLAGLSKLLGVWTLPAAAFLGALATAALVFALARRDGLLDPTTMLLCGIAINALTGAGIGLLTYLATDEQLRNLTFWSLGSLGAATWGSLAGVSPAALLVLLVVPFLVRPLNALLLGESEAMHLGVAVERLKRVSVVLAAAGAGAVVAVWGVIGFIGLVAPHMARLMAGPDHRTLLPLAALLGATLLTAGDLVARTAVRPAELPIGILTALLGAPFFLWLLRRRSGGWA
ncbi:MAG: FecCD family ABC transporter permease, partial [Pseudomonadota bacterium]